MSSLLGFAFFDDIAFGFLFAFVELLMDVFALVILPLELVLASAVAVDFVGGAVLELLLDAVKPADGCCMIDDGR